MHACAWQSGECRGNAGEHGRSWMDTGKRRGSERATEGAMISAARLVLTQNIVAHDVDVRIAWPVGQLENWNLRVRPVPIQPKHSVRAIQLHQEAVDQLRT